MNKRFLNQKDRQLMTRLQAQLDDLRRRLGISERGRILFRAELSYGDDEVVLVEADGFGGGVLRIVEGNYPVDYLTREERTFSTEVEATNAAAALKYDVA
ncbi:MAG TPA: hypothetical protein VFF95_19565 [Candidatus Binatus sp.]|jgi:hypothetical protein|nr:hypothetical protein [Candidatus Binatus sp.]